MRSQANKLKVGWSRVLLGLALVVLAGFSLYPSIASLYPRYLAWDAERYCKTMLAEGKIYNASDDYASQLENCERNPRFCVKTNVPCLN